MNSLCFIILAVVLAGNEAAQQYVLQHIQPFFYAENCLGIIHEVAQTLMTEQRVINLITMRDALVTDIDSAALAARLQAFRDYFVNEKILTRRSTDDEVICQITILLAQIQGALDPDLNLELAVKSFTVDYVSRAKKEILELYKKKMKDSPSTDYSDDLIRRLKELNHYLNSSTWELYVYDFAALEREAEEVALVSLKDSGIFYRSNVYLISGFAGSMKSYFSLAIAAAALNQGVGADRTLSFWSLARPNKVLFADTELAKNTVIARWKSLKAMVGGIVNPFNFKYLALRKVPGSKAMKMQILTEACDQFLPDILIIDSIRDLCVDYNDSAEAESLVDNLKILATKLNAVVIVTSHRSLGVGNAKGHLGVRLNEACALEMSLTKKADVGAANQEFLAVEFPKMRDGLYDSFNFRFNPDLGYPVEYAPTVDSKEERRTARNAELIAYKVMTPGVPIRYSDLVRGIREKGGVAESTAKSYLRSLLGTIIVRDDDGKYCLADPERAIPFDGDDLPES